MKWIAAVVLRASVRVAAWRIGYTAPFRHVRLLTSLGEPAGPYMVPLLGHPSGEVRAAAFKAMRILKVSDEEILRGLDAALNIRVDAHLVGCVGRTPCAGAVEVLDGVLKRDRSSREAVVRALGNLRDPRALPILDGLLTTSSTEPRVWQHALDALARIEDPEVPRILERELAAGRRRLAEASAAGPERGEIEAQVTGLERTLATMTGASGRQPAPD